MRGLVMKKYKVTFEDVAHHLTEEQRVEYTEDEEYKKIIDAAIRRSNRTGSLKGVPNRSNNMQKAYKVLSTLSPDEVETLKTLPARIQRANEVRPGPTRVLAFRQIDIDMPVTEGFAFEPALTILSDYNQHLYSDLL